MINVSLETSAREDFENILCDSIQRRIERSSKARPSAAAQRARAYLSKFGLEKMATLYPQSFVFACNEMGIPPTVEAANNLSQEPE